MVTGHTGTGVFGIEHGVDDELANVVVVQPVDHLRPFTPGVNEPRHSQFCEVLRYGRRGLGHALGEFVD